MASLRKVVVPFLLMGLLIVAGCGNEERIEVPKQSVSVVDGDTIKVKMKKKEETVRLLFVDTPEINHPNFGKQPLGDEAKAFTQKLINEAKKIELEKEETKRDKYGRFLAYLHVDGKLLQEELVKEGFARIAYVEQPDAKYLEELRKAEQEAKRKKVGIWQWDSYTKKDGFHVEALKNERNIFVASKNSDVYHPIGCHVVKDIKPENLMYFYSEQEAMKTNRHRSGVKECWSSYK
ncbi:thermonuclease family protein [Laceyella tengchongensis]